MHLRVQVVEDDPLLRDVRELACQRRTDEAGAARDEDATAGLLRGRHGTHRRCRGPKPG